MREEAFTFPGLDASKVVLSSEYAVERYCAFHYTGRWLENPEYQHVRTRTSAVNFTLPTEYPWRTKARALCASWPGLDVCAGFGLPIHWHRRPGAYWHTSLGQPLLRQLGGGLEALRQWLSFSDVSLHSQDEERVLLTLREWPDLAEAGPSPSLCALVCLLKSFFPREKIPAISFHQEDMTGGFAASVGEPSDSSPRAHEARL